MTLTKEYNDKIKSGKIKTHRRNCICHSDKFNKVTDYDRHGLWQPVVICKECGLIQNNPQLLDEEYAAFYSSDLYRKIYSGDDYLVSAKDRYADTNQIFDTLEPIMKERSFTSIIEFGCGGGWNLLPFQNSNYEVVGYDYSTDLIKLGKAEYDLDLRQGSFNEIKELGKYDVLILNHVVEHFTDLENNIRELTRLIKPDGIIYIGIPNIDIIDRGQFQNAHTFYFTERTFCHYMQKFGLEVIEFGPDESIHMHGIFKIANNKNSSSSITLEHEFNLMRRKLMIGVAKIKIINLLDSLNLLGIVKKVAKTVFR
jgi:2-polyprenyl-3-methyl-5-hydroxy-6-metoxy-1,4-benzoquinol methylase